MARQSVHNIIGIDIGSSCVRGVVVQEKEGVRYKEVIASHKLPLEGVDKGNITDIAGAAEGLQDVVKILEHKIGGQADTVLIALGGSHITCYHVNGHTLISRGDGSVSDIDIEKALKDGERGIADIKNKTILHTIPLRFKLDGQEVTGNIIGLRGHKLEVKALFITYPRQYSQTLTETLEKADLEVADIIAGPIAESIPLLTKKQKLAGVAIVHIGAETTSLLVYENNTPLLVSILPVGGIDITKDIALGLKVSLEEAEDIKCGTGAVMFSKRRVDEIIEARIEDIGEKINKELDRIHRKELLPAGILVLGDTTMIPRIDQTLRYVLKLPIKIAHNELAPLSNNTITDPAWARAYGLSFLAPEIIEHQILAQYTRRFMTTLKRFFVQFLP